MKFLQAGSSLNPGQMLSLGVPRRSTIRSICEISLVPGSRGLCASSSPRIQPTAHMSIAVVCSVEPRRSSGGLWKETCDEGVEKGYEENSYLYQRVTNPGVIGFGGTLNVLANPKSAIFKHPVSVRRRLLTLMSRCMMKLAWRYSSP